MDPSSLRAGRARRRHERDARAQALRTELEQLPDLDRGRALVLMGLLANVALVAFVVGLVVGVRSLRQARRTWRTAGPRPALMSVATTGVPLVLGYAALQRGLGWITRRSLRRLVARSGASGRPEDAGGAS